MKSCDLSKWSEDRSLVMKYQWLIERAYQSLHQHHQSIIPGRLSITNSEYISIDSSRILSIDNISNWQLAIDSYKSSKRQRAHGLMWQMLHQFWKLNQKKFSQILRTSKPTISGKATRISSFQMFYQVLEIRHL